MAASLVQAREHANHAGVLLQQTNHTDDIRSRVASREPAEMNEWLIAFSIRCSPRPDVTDALFWLGICSGMRYRGGRSDRWVEAKNRKHPAFSRVLDQF